MDKYFVEFLTKRDFKVSVHVEADDVFTAAQKVEARFKEGTIDELGADWSDQGDDETFELVTCKRD